MQRFLFWITNNAGLKSLLVSHCPLKLLSNNTCARGWLSCIKAIFATTSDFEGWFTYFRLSSRFSSPHWTAELKGIAIIRLRFPRTEFITNINIIILSFMYITCDFIYFFNYFPYTCDKRAMDKVLFRQSSFTAILASIWTTNRSQHLFYIEMSDSLRQYNLVIVNCTGTARLLSRESRSSLQVKVYIVARWYIKYSSVFGVGIPYL